MRDPLLDDLTKSGLHSINIIFNSSSIFTDSGWEIAKNDEGQKLYLEIKKCMNYRVDEVHSTVWQNGEHLRMDTCYSVNLEFPLLKRKNEVILVVKQILGIIRKFSCAQVIINDQFAIEEKHNRVFENYLH